MFIQFSPRFIQTYTFFFFYDAIRHVDFTLGTIPIGRWRPKKKKKNRIVEFLKASELLWRDHCLVGNFCDIVERYWRHRVDSNSLAYLHHHHNTLPVWHAVAWKSFRRKMEAVSCFFFHKTRKDSFFSFRIIFFSWGIKKLVCFIEFELHN